ncbi:hypothetical protein HAX54_017600, partial [Datura stramonium]|nr:hypothetical protein [Datura stramonium]
GTEAIEAIRLAYPQREKLNLGSQTLKQLQSLEAITYSICGLRCLRTLDLSGCSKLETLPKLLANWKLLEEVALDGTAITSYHQLSPKWEI